MIWAASLWKKFSTFKYALKDIVESIYHTSFEGMWSSIINSLWWSLDLFIISNFLTIFPFLILNHEVPLFLFLVKIGHLFIIHRKIWIFHILVLTLIPINITSYYVWNLYWFIISMFSSINILFIFTFGKFPGKQDWYSAISCGGSIPT